MSIETQGGLGVGGKIEISEKLPPIPIETVEGWKNILVQDCGEECDTNAAYFGERGKGESMNFLEGPVDRKVSIITHFVREGVLEKLRKAQASHY